MKSAYEQGFAPKDNLLFELADEYHARCEAFDRTVCTGPVTQDGVLPATARELGAVGRNARIVLSEIYARAESAGFSRNEIRRAIAQRNAS